MATQQLRPQDVTDAQIRAAVEAYDAEMRQPVEHVVDRVLAGFYTQAGGSLAGLLYPTPEDEARTAAWDQAAPETRALAARVREAVLRRRREPRADVEVVDYLDD